MISRAFERGRRVAFAFLDKSCRDTCSKHWAEKSGDSNHSVKQLF